MVSPPAVPLGGHGRGTRGIRGTRLPSGMRTASPARTRTGCATHGTVPGRRPGLLSRRSGGNGGPGAVMRAGVRQMADGTRLVHGSHTDWVVLGEGTRSP